MGYVSVLGECFIHKGLFHFHPEQVISLRVRENGLPLDVHDDGTPGREFTQEEYDNAGQIVICPSCVLTKVNPALREQGKPEVQVFDGEPYQEV